MYSQKWSKGGLILLFFIIIKKEIHILYFLKKITKNGKGLSLDYCSKLMLRTTLKIIK